ncbi:MAG: hypothetical protein J4F43_10795 [Dehalococcoidia bacterium]|nr:hypothetical protein [Dehalococcoidia bacterium]
MMARIGKNAAHALLFLLAFVVFYIGLGVGLQHNPDLGTALWIAAGAIVALNLFWIHRSRG